MIRTVLLTIIALTVCACQGPSVKRGQLEIPNDMLPLACLTIGIKGGGWPLEKAVFENATTHKRVSFILNKSINASHPDYLTAVESGSNALSMAIVHLEPGDYFIREIEFSPMIATAVATTAIAFNETHGFRFSIIERAAVYLGSLYITPDWQDVRKVLRPIFPYTHGNQGNIFANYEVVATQKRDKKWAEDVIPGMRKIPSIFCDIVAY
jgi:hypothetical protein